MTKREHKGAKKRLPEFVLVAYFFARCGQDDPPPQLCVERWADAYDTFYLRIADGRTRTAFRNSMKNARDVFDAHLRTGRVGWKEGTKPRALNPVSKDVLHQWRDKSDDALWNAVRVWRT